VIREIKLPIRVRLTIWYSAVLAAIIICLGGALAVRLKADLLLGLDTTLANRADEISRAVSGPLTSQDAVIADTTKLAGIPRGDAIAQILGSDGRLRQASGEAEVIKPLISPGTVRSIRSPIRRTLDVGPEPEPYRVFAQRLPGQQGVLVVGASTDQVTKAVRRLLALLALGGPAAIALSALVGYWLAGQALKPVDRMTRSAAVISSDDPSARLEVPALEDEVGRLGRTLNQMLERLQAGIEEQRRFTADASHELRTPLAILAGEIDVALRSPAEDLQARPVLESLREETTRMTKTVEDLLILARLDDEGPGVSFEKVELLGLCKRAADRFSTAAEAKGLQISVEGEPAVVWGNEAQLMRLLSNLVDNAIKHTADEGSVDLLVLRDRALASLAVSDSGSGIPLEALPHVFDRFYRVDKARSRAEGGTGLGLSICQAIAHAHGGTITLESEVGQGTTVKVSLPEDQD
jgi:heavy metal sensor kinase